MEQTIHDNLKKAKELEQDGNKLMSRYKYKEAADSFKQALDLKVSCCTEHDIELAHSHANLGNAYKEMLLDQEASKHLYEALKIHSKTTADERFQAEQYAKLGEIFEEVGKVDESQDCLLAAKNIMFKLHRENDPILIDVYLTIAKVHMGKEEYTKALENINAAEHIATLQFGDKSSHLARVFLCKGEVYSIKSLEDKAEECYTNAFEIRKALGEEKTREIAHCYDALASKYLGESEQAGTYLMDALKIRKEIFGEDGHPDIALSYQLIGDNFLFMEKHDDCLQWFTKAADLLKKLLGERYHYANCCERLANVNNDKGHYSTAVAWANKDIEIKTSLLGENSLAVGEAYSNLASIHGTHLKFAEAAENFQKAVKIFEAAGAHLGKRITLYFKTGHTLIDSHKGSEGLAYYEKAIDGLIKGLKEHPISILESEAFVAFVEVAIRDKSLKDLFDKHHSEYKQSLEAFKKHEELAREASDYLYELLLDEEKTEEEADSWLKLLGFK